MQRTLNNKRLYYISVIGCDDQTDLRVELTDEEALIVSRIAIMTMERSHYDCMPVLNIEEWDEATYMIQAQENEHWKKEITKIQELQESI